MITSSVTFIICFLAIVEVYYIFRVLTRIRRIQRHLEEIETLIQRKRSKGESRPSHRTMWDPKPEELEE